MTPSSTQGIYIHGNKIIVGKRDKMGQKTIYVEK